MKATFFSQSLRRILRIINFFLAKASFWLGLKFSLGTPYSIHLELSNRCNLHCPLCPTGSGKLDKEKKDLSLEEVKMIFSKLNDRIIFLYLHGFGESFLNKELCSIIRYLKIHYGPWIEISTNGQIFTDQGIEELIESGLDQLVVPIESLDEMLYQRYRSGGELERVLCFISKVIKRRAHLKVHLPKVKVQCIVMNHNEHTLSVYKHKILELGIDGVIFKTLGVLTRDFKKAMEYLPTQERYRRYESDTLAIKEKELCRNVYESLMINVHGEVYPCCRDAMQEYQIGNLMLERLDDVWNGKRMRKLRYALRQNTNMPQMCSVCASGDVYLKV